MTGDKYQLESKQIGLLQPRIETHPGKSGCHLLMRLYRYNTGWREVSGNFVRVSHIVLFLIIANLMRLSQVLLTHPEGGGDEVGLKRDRPTKRKDEEAR